MCPLVSSPVRGYADWQRVSNWDSALVFSAAAHDLSVTPDASGIFDTSRFAYVGGTDFLTSGACLVNAIWYADPLGATMVGQRIYMLSGSIGPAYYRLPNLGPFCQITWGARGAGAVLHTCDIFVSNRVHPLEFIPDHPVLVSQQGAAIAASATAFNYPASYYAGPIQIGFSGVNIAPQILCQYLDTNNVWQYWDQSANQPNNTWTQFRTVAPPGAWRVSLVNTTAAAGSYYLVVTPPTTGAT